MFDEQRWPNRAVDRHSPAKALFRLYGTGAPAAAIGIPVDHLVVGSTSVTADLGTFEMTTGSVETLVPGSLLDGNFEYTLRWRMQDGGPVLLEVLPSFGVTDRLPVRAKLPRGVAARLHDLAPHPRLALDAGAAEIWSFVGELGLPIVARCLAAWWRTDDPGLDPASTAACIVQLVARRAGVPRTSTANLFGPHGTVPDQDDIERLSALVHLTREQPW